MAHLTAAGSGRAIAVRCAVAAAAIDRHMDATTCHCNTTVGRARVAVTAILRVQAPLALAR